MAPVTLILLALLYGAVGSPTGGPSTLQQPDPTTVVLSYYGNVNDADVQGNVDLLSDDAVFVTNRPGDGPSISTEGRDAILAAQRAAVANGLQFTLADVTASGDTVTFTSTWTYTSGPQAGALFTANSTATVENGLIVSLTQDLTSADGSTSLPAGAAPAQST